jgi:L-ascorbate metabolism protein UlaG (beta-lactamase superfamily)
MKIKWLGWDSFKLNLGGKTIYIDPISGNYDETGDIVLVSHGHGDHCDPGVLDKIRDEKTTVITSVPNAVNVNGIGLHPGEKLNLDEISIYAVHAYNIVRMREPGIPFHPKGFGVGWIIEYSGKRIYFLGDTDLIPEMRDIDDVDLMLIPVSGKFVMDIEEAIETVKLIKPIKVVPMHYGTVDVVSGDKPRRVELEADVTVFKEKLSEVAEVILLKQNEELIF